MRRIHRAASIVLLLTLATGLAACADGFDPDKLDVLGLNEKKKLPGKREALFPNGVPGVEQGIPPEYMKGNLAQQPGAAVPVGPLATQPAGAPNAQTASAEPPAAEQAKEKPKAKPKKRVAARPKPTRVRIAPKPAVQPAQAQPAPAQAQQQAPSPWPDQQQSVPAPWPSAPPPGTFSKQ